MTTTDTTPLCLLPRRSTASRRAVSSLLIGGICLAIAACHPAGTATPIDPIEVQRERQRRLFGDFDIPHQIGTVENVGLQLPVISPDGQQMLYLRTDCESLSPMTILGSADPQDTPPDKTLSIWLRPVTGTGAGRQLTQCPWAHSPIWSDSGAAVACVANNPPRSDIVHMDMSSGKVTILGVRGAVNCLPRFDGDDRTLLFCSGEQAMGPFRVYRQAIDDAAPTAISPAGADCLFPISSDKAGRVLCLQADGDYLHWATCTADGITLLAPKCTLGGRPALLQTFAGVSSPLSPDRRSVLFFDAAQAAISVFDVRRRQILSFLSKSITACWIDEQDIADASDRDIIIVNTTTAMRADLPGSRSWIPCRYVPSSRRLILLGQQHARRFSVWEIVFTGNAAGTR